MFVMVGRRQVKYSFSSQVGTRSSEHDVEGFLLRLLLQERERLVYRPLHLDYHVVGVGLERYSSLGSFKFYPGRMH